MHNKREQGMTLIEMLLVIIILAIASSVAVPALSSLDDMQLELVSRDLQRAIRFAHSESIRTGYSYGLTFEDNDSRFRLYKYHTTIDYEVYSPVEKQPYELVFGTNQQGVSIRSKSIKFESFALNKQSHIAFAGGSGTPVSGSVGNTKMLEYARIELSYNNNIAVLNISPISGRVTLQ